MNCPLAAPIVRFNPCSICSAVSGAVIRLRPGLNGLENIRSVSLFVLGVMGNNFTLVCCGLIISMVKK